MKFFLLLLTTSAGLLVSANSDQPIYALSTCELMYSAHPHSKAIVALGDERLAQVHSLEVSETAQYSRFFLALTEDISEQVASTSEGSLVILDQDLVLGGYAGVSTTTAVVRAAVHSAKGYDALLRLASHIGYVYAQESTLVICEGQPVGNWRSVVSLEITDTGEESFLSEHNAIRLYGLIVGAFNGPDNIGYTYYPDTRVFSTLAGLSRGKQGRAIVEELTTWLSALSNEDVQFGLAERPVWIFYPHNDWETNPHGGSYTTYMAENKTNAGLLQKRKRFLEMFDRYFSLSH